MSVSHHVVAFDRPLRAAQFTNDQTLRHTLGELAAARAEGFVAGQKSVEERTGQQMVELRSEVQRLQQGLFARLAEGQTMLEAQVREALPQLTVELGARLLAGFCPTAEQMARICGDALEQLYPERSGLELVLGTSDAEMLGHLVPDWEADYPGLRVTVDASMAAGDCLVRSRFGVTDARAQVKLDSLRHELLPT
jgi:flagellar assembly protein FliH